MSQLAPSGAKQMPMSFHAKYAFICVFHCKEYIYTITELEITGGHRTFAVHFTKVTDQLPFC